MTFFEWKRGRAAARFALLVAAVSTAVWSGCGGDGEAQEGAGTVKIRTVAVETEPVAHRSFIDYFELLGTVRGEREATLVFEVGGVLEEIIADKGRLVRKGDAIARLNDDIYRSGKDEAVAGLEIARETYDRSKALQSKGAISDIGLTNLQQQYEMARARYQSSKVQLDRATLRSPFDGVVDSRYLDEGDYASPMTPFARLIDLSRVKVEIPIPETHLAKIRPGGAAWISAAQYPDQTFEGTITYVSREVESSTRTLHAEVTLDNPEGLLRPGMTVRAKLIKHEYKGAIVVPQDAVVNTENGTGVFLAVEGLAESRLVDIEAVYGEMAVVRSGLRGGETLITVGARDLVHGEAIEVVGGESVNVDH